MDRRARTEARGHDLKAVNPHRKAEADERTPEQILEAIEANGREVAEALAALRQAGGGRERAKGA